MSSVQEVLDTQRQIEQCLLSKMASFEKQLQSSDPTSKPSLERLSCEFCEFKTSVCSILTMLRSLVSSLLYKVDELDNQNRSNALLFSGVPECDGENCMDTILNIIHSKMGLVDIKETSFMSCHRLGAKNEKRSRPILVRFTYVTCRRLIWKEKKRLKSSSVVVSEFLTKTRQEIFTAARKHFGITCCWTQGGTVFVKLPDNERKRIASTEVLDKFIAKFPIPGTVNVGTDPTKGPTSRPRTPAVISPASAVAPEQPRTRRNFAAKSKPSK